MTLEITKTLVKHIAAIHNSAALNTIQRKVVNIFLENALRDDFESKVHKLPLSRLMRELGWSANSKGTDSLKHDLKELAKIQVEWNVLKTDRKNKWVAMQLLAEVGIENGIITYAYPPTLKELLFYPNIYAKLDLNTQKELTTRYGVALWELLSGEFSIKQQINVQTNWIEYRTLLKIFGLSDSVYASRFADFFKKILDPSIKDVSLKSEFNVSYELEKEGRKVSKIRFVAQIKESISQTIKSLPAITNFKEEAIKAKLESLGFNSRFINGTMKKYRFGEIEVVIELFEKALKEEKVKFPVAFFKKALEEGWVTKDVMHHRLEESAAQNSSSEEGEIRLEIAESDESDSIKTLRLHLLKLLGTTRYIAWFKEVSLSFDNYTLKFKALSQYNLDWIESRYRSLIQEAAEQAFNTHNLKIEYTVENEKERDLV